MMALITSDHRTTMLQGIPGVGMAPTEGVVHAAEALLKLVSRRRFQCPFRTRRVLERFLERFCTVFAGVQVIVDAEHTLNAAVGWVLSDSSVTDAQRR